jgi:hypothetical protein
MMYLERLTSVAEADFFNSNTAGINACSSPLAGHSNSGTALTAIL